MDKRINLRDFSMLIALILIAAYFYTRDARFLSSRNLAQLGIELSATAVLALPAFLAWRASRATAASAAHRSHHPDRAPTALG